MSEVPTMDELRAFMHKQIAECRRHRPEQVDDLLEKLHNINETHAFIEQVVGERAAAAWVPTVPINLTAPTVTAAGGCSCGYRAGSRPTQIGCGNGQCPFVKHDDD